MTLTAVLLVSSVIFGAGAGSLLANKIVSPVLRTSKFRAVLAIVFGVAAWWMVSQAASLEAVFAMRGWPQTQGTVVQSEVGAAPMFRPQITYSYAVDGESYQATTDLGTPAFGGKGKRRETASTIVAAYPAGKQVAVYFSPDSPARSVLRISAKFSAFLQLGISWLLATVALAGALVAVFGNKESLS